MTDHSEDTVDLLPCPFCGEPPRYGERMDEDICTHNQVIWKSVRCLNDCAQIEIPDGYQGGTAVERWNTRAALAAMPAQGWQTMDTAPKDVSQNFMWGDFFSDKEELDARRRFMLDNGHSLCSIPACNCGSWHGGHASRRLSEISDLLRELDVPTNGLTIIDAIRAALSPTADAPPAREVSVAEAALRSIRNELHGCLSAFGDDLRYAVGNTNVACLKIAVERADAALRVLTGETP